MISHGVEISIPAGGADEEDEGNGRLFFFFIIMYSLLKYKRPRGALAMACIKL